jgi:UDP-N-acetylmuramoyl-tripeptide--D-alanyl-D-alanine ligase
MLVFFLDIAVLITIATGLTLIYIGVKRHGAGAWPFGLALIIAYPVLWAHLVVVPLIIGRTFIVKPKNFHKLKGAEKIFAEHKGLKIAIAGSYGKTSMKELLSAVLSEGKKVAATPANKNVSTSHAIFARGLSGDEDILIIEYGEGAPGDVRRFSLVTHPTHAVITGLAPAHLDKYKTLKAAGDDILSVTKFVPENHVYINQESPKLKGYIKKSFNTYSSSGSLGWKVSNVKITVNQTSFIIKKDKESLDLHSGLIGRHHLGGLVFAAAFALELGLSKDEVAKGIARTIPFEHRMQPYELNGAWVIDDTYNGNIEGIKAGTELLSELEAKRKVYVTPGLVDQGKEKKAVHIELGKLIAKARPDLVVLMDNSACKYIQEGLNEAKFGGKVTVEKDPLNFYTGLKNFVAAGDLIVLQNDWPDQYK